MKKLEIVETNLNDPKHAEAVVFCTDQYARDAMGMKRPLDDHVKSVLIDNLKAFPSYIGFLAFIDGQPAGIANCVYSFSSFKARKVINIHDLAVNPQFRGNGIGEALLAEVERKAKEENCCKVTLEVREDNRARHLYERAGFSYGEPRMFFMEKEV
ncbi:GNAT family N-acetyltransferase [Rhodohalobacter halophilus]|uniref:GNAT family N-acetyltransferase n=1 Tax=Rhodohalobacter halophilus TaxID=1812810 RepID=UPI00083F75EC|nr:GNAT family N-acetyltransferase [Rhodohalobacter halophilus]